MQNSDMGMADLHKTPALSKSAMIFFFSSLSQPPRIKNLIAQKGLAASIVGNPSFFKKY